VNRTVFAFPAFTDFSTLRRDIQELADKNRSMEQETGLLSTIGNTPLVELKKLYPDLSSRLYAKLEMFNPGGSTKDRTARLMISRALAEGKITQNSTIVESSSGNMAIGLAQTCRYLGLNLIVVTDPKINSRTLDLLRVYGARIERVTEPDASGNYLKNRLKRVRQLLETIPDSYWPNQYSNDLNPAAHCETMKEIVNSCPEPPDYILAATSTCGTIMGCADFIRKHHLNTKVVAVDAAGSVIFGPSKGRRLIPGHGAGRKSDLLDESCIDHVFHISDRECAIGCRRLLNREAILAGGSAGAVVMAAEKLQTIIPEGSTCAMIFSDSGERYLDTIYNDRWVESHFGNIEELMTEALAPQKTPVLVNKDEIELSANHTSGNSGRLQDYT
jgi:N-(2-amino-2-carboxyethyl)-L-glutamate synthase